MDQTAFAAVRAAQADVFTRAQALRCGMSASQAATAIKAGQWKQVAGKGFVLAGESIGPEQGAWAATLSVPNSIVWGPSAIKLWRPEAPIPAVGAIWVAKPGRYRSRYRIVVRAIRIPVQDIANYRGLSVQSEPGALIDSLAVLAGPDADSLFAWSLSRDLVSPPALDEMIAARARRRGVRRLKTYAAMARSGAGSAAELRFHLILKQNGIDSWQANVRVRLPNGVTARVDVLFAKQKLVIEVDGWQAHGTKTAFQKDRARQNELVAAGYQVLRFTWEDITAHPDHCAHRVIRALAARA